MEEEEKEVEKEEEEEFEVHSWYCSGKGPPFSYIAQQTFVVVLLVFEEEFPILHANLKLAI